MDYQIPPQLDPSKELPPPHHDFNSRLWILMTAVIALALVAFAVVWFWKDINDYLPNSSNAEDISTWKMYRNDQYGFEFKYPKDFQLDPGGSLVGDPQIENLNKDLQDPQRGKGYIISNGVLFVDYTEFEAIKDNTTGSYNVGEFYITRDDEVDSLPVGSIIQKEGSADRTVIEENGVRGFKYTSLDDPAPERYSIYASFHDKNHNQISFEVPFKDGETKEQILKDPLFNTFDKILSTFKFTDSFSYRNNQFGFLIPLPSSWRGYTINQIKEDMYDTTGKTKTNNGVIDNFPIVEIHHPLESAENPREDMPVMVFTPVQWDHIQKGQWSVSAAPIPPSLLGQNSKYVLALPARYNYDYKPGWEEVDELVHTLQAFEPGQGEVCIQVITRAKNPQTGEIRDFPTPCDVPAGWQTI